MANDTLVLIYEHREGCERQGQRVTVRPPCDDGVAFVARPVCIEFGAELVEVGREVH